MDNLHIECENGLHGLPYETLVKDIERQERSKKKAADTRATKIAEKMLAEFQKKLFEKDDIISSLEAEIGELKMRLEKQNETIMEYNRRQMETDTISETPEKQAETESETNIPRDEEDVFEKSQRQLKILQAMADEKSLTSNDIAILKKAMGVAGQVFVSGKTQDMQDVLDGPRETVEKRLFRRQRIIANVLAKYRGIAKFHGVEEQLIRLAETSKRDFYDYVSRVA